MLTKISFSQTVNETNTENKPDYSRLSPSLGLSPKVTERVTGASSLAWPDPIHKKARENRETFPSWTRSAGMHYCVIAVICQIANELHSK